MNLLPTFQLGYSKNTALQRRFNLWKCGKCLKLIKDKKLDLHTERHYGKQAHYQPLLNEQ